LGRVQAGGVVTLDQVDENSIATMIVTNHLLMKRGKVGAYYSRNDDDWERVVIIGRRNEGGSVAGQMMPKELLGVDRMYSALNY
jgi:hypothetical protein